MLANQANREDQANKYVVHFNNHGELMRHYTIAPTPAKAKANAAYTFSLILGINVGLTRAKMKGRCDIVQLNG